jgi:flagellar basal-body rod modification protein FlgD
VTQTAATTGAGSTQPTGAPPVNSSPQAELGKDSFLKLLVAQLQHQDPANPMDSGAFMGQLAQFSSLEQMTNVASSVDKLNASNSVSQSVALIGHQLIFTRADGSTGTGVADGVSIKDGTAAIDVDGESITLASITAVGPAVSPTTSTTNPTA